MAGSAPWQDLARLLAGGASGPVRLWLRDDDATVPSPQLDALLSLTTPARVPLALAVIPAHTGPELRQRLAQEELVTPVVHGWAHRNHSPPDRKKAELGDGRPLAEVTAELQRGLARLTELYGPRLCPVLVPPWNRIAAPLLPQLGHLGFCALSTFGEPPASAPVPQVNTHLDIMDWRGTRECRPPGELVAELIGHIGRRAPLGLPVGILTHHLVHDAQAWSFLDALFAVTKGHWIDVAAALRLELAAARQAR